MRGAPFMQTIESVSSSLTTLQKKVDFNSLKTLNFVEIHNLNEFFHIPGFENFFFKTFGFLKH